MTAALALAGASQGLRVQMIELESRGELAGCFDVTDEVGYAPVTIYEHPCGGTVSLRQLRPDDALVEWLKDHGFGRLLVRLRASGALEVIATAVPGIRDVLVLGKIKALSRDETVDVILVDAPATGHSLSLLTSPASLVAAARSGPIRRQAEEVATMLRDESRCCVTLVTLASELPVTEAVEAAYNLEDRTDVSLSNIIVNQFEGGSEALRHALSEHDFAQLGSELARSVEVARYFSLARGDEEERQRERLSRELPLAQIVVPRLDADVIDLARLAHLASELLESVPT